MGLPAHDGDPRFFGSTGGTQFSTMYSIQYLFIREFSILKITTTTHNDIVCISFNSKSARSNPPIFLYMQKEDSLSFTTVFGSGGHGQSLLTKICVSAK